MKLIFKMVKSNSRLPALGPDFFTAAQLNGQASTEDQYKNNTKKMPLVQRGNVKRKFFLVNAEISSKTA